MRCLSVLYDPASYIHPQRMMVPVGAGRALLTLLNQQILLTYQLPLLGGGIRECAIATRLIADWACLRAAAGLLGAKLARGYLVRSGRLADASLRTRRFVALPIPCLSVDPPLSLSKAEQLEAVGAAYLKCLLPSLPAAVAARLSLPFAPGVWSALSLPTGSVLDPSLLYFALDYAKTDPVES